MCGPTNGIIWLIKFKGCNCSSCMELDLALRNLPSKGYAVNRLSMLFINLYRKDRIAIQKG